MDLSFEISMSSFFQTNPLCAEKLYTKVIEYTFLQNNSTKPIILDLFCGTGTIAQMIASEKKESKIIGVDIIESAIKNAQKKCNKK